MTPAFLRSTSFALRPSPPRQLLTTLHARPPFTMTASVAAAANRPLYAVAPMMDVTDRHYRALARLISRRATLYTEMVVDRTVIHNPKLRFLELRIPPFPDQHPVVLQLGGSDPTLMKHAAQLAAEHPYVEININCGCPSPKVADNGCFGAALMKSPHLVAEIASNMAAVLEDVPVTVKCRLGLEWNTDLSFVRDFIRTIHQQAGVTHFIIHSRNAILGGLSPAKNRSIPPLRYDDVYQLINDFPHLNFSINGGIRTIDDVLHHLDRGAYGVMVGRAAMDAPWQALCQVDSKIYQSPNTQPDGSVTTRRHIIRDYMRYANSEIEETGCSARAVLKPLLNLFHGERNGKLWRRSIDEGLRDNISFEDIINLAIQVVPEEVLDAIPGSKPSPLHSVLASDNANEKFATETRSSGEKDMDQPLNGVRLSPGNELDVGKVQRPTVTVDDVR